METGHIIVFVGLLVFLAHFFVALFERTRIPDVLYLTLIGVIIGPLLQIVSPGDFGKIGAVFTTVALVVILFEGGLELSLENLRRSLKGTLFITILSYFISLALIAFALLMLTNLLPRAALFVAAVLAGPAPSVVIPLARQLRLTDTSRTTLMLESPLGEALCIIVALAILETFKVEEVHVGLLVGKLLSSFVFAFVIGAIGGYVWSLLLNRMRQLRHAIFTTPSFVFIVFGIAEFLGYSGPVAALTFGITLGNIDFIKIPKLLKQYDLKPLRHNETEKQFFGEIVFVVKTFFFVYIGLSVQFADTFSLGLAFALSGILLAARLLATRLAIDTTKTPVEDALAMSVMIPKGTAAAVLAGIPLQMSIAGGALIQNLTYGVVIFSIIFTAGLVFLLEKTSFAAANRWLFAGFTRSASAPVREEEKPAGEKKSDAGGSRYL
ncbi:MAG TPA: cation:proton antiporter [Bacteroidota bacterium]